MSREVYPLAGAILRPTKTNKWKYRTTPGHGSTSLHERVMSVPTGDSGDDGYARLHEQGHVRWSRIVRPKSVAPDVWERIEEVRIHSLIEPLMLNDERKGYTFLVNAHVEQTKRAGLGRRAAALKALEANGHRMDEYIKEDSDREFLTWLIEQVRETNTKEDNEKFSQFFERVFGEKPMPKAPPPVLSHEPVLPTTTADLSKMSARKRKELAKSLGMTERISEATLPKLKALMDAEATRRKKSMFPKGVRPDEESYGGGNTGWGRMTVKRPPLDLTHEPARKAMRMRLSDQGSRVVRISRLITDQMCFGEKRRQKGGTLVLDGSGSMSVSPDEITMLLKEAPAATVAYYSGDGRKGDLVVIAEKGKMAREEHYERPGGNVVDGPALEWLNKQPGPRYWVTDWGVTGYGDQPEQVLLAECQALVKKGGIKVYRNVKETVEAIGKKRS